MALEENLDLQVHIRPVGANHIWELHRSILRKVFGQQSSIGFEWLHFHSSIKFVHMNRLEKIFSGSWVLSIVLCRQIFPSGKRSRTVQTIPDFVTEWPTPSPFPQQCPKLEIALGRINSPKLSNTETFGVLWWSYHTTIIRHSFCFSSLLIFLKKNLKNASLSARFQPVF